jgi:NADPH2:quinone reductase
LYSVPGSALDSAVEDITAALGAGALTELPVHHFSLAETAAAQEAVEAGTQGKVIVVP